MANKVLTFSPPAKAAEPKVEEAVLLLQPFSEAPQISFEQVPVGREAVRQLRVINPSQLEHMVTLSGGLSQKGFSVDDQVFKVLPGQYHLVTFVWKPDGREASSRVALTVSSNKGFKGRCVLLGTAKSQPPKPVRKVPRPTMNVLTTSQQHNLIHPVPANPKSCKKAAAPLKPTVPKEFRARTKKSTFAANSSSSLHNAKTSQVPAVPQSSGEAGSDVAALEKLVSATFTLCDSKESLRGSSLSSGDMQMHASTCEPTMPVLDPAEETMEARKELAAEPASAVFQDSLEVGDHAGSATSKSTLNDAASHEGQNDTFELDLSVRVERLYQHALEKKSSGDVPDPTSELDLSAHLTALYEEMQERKSKQRTQSPERVSSEQLLPESTRFEEHDARHALLEGRAAKTTLEVSPLCKKLMSEHFASSPKRVSQEGVQLPDIQGMLDELNLCLDHPEDGVDADSLLEMMEKYGSSGLLEEHVLVEDFFPSDISSINGPPGNSTGGSNRP